MTIELSAVFDAFDFHSNKPIEPRNNFVGNAIAFTKQEMDWQTGHSTIPLGGDELVPLLYEKIETYLQTKICFHNTNFVNRVKDYINFPICNFFYIRSSKIAFFEFHTKKNYDLYGEEAYYWSTFIGLLNEAIETILKYERQLEEKGLVECDLSMKLIPAWLKIIDDKSLLRLLLNEFYDKLTKDYEAIKPQKNYEHLNLNYFKNHLNLLKAIAYYCSQGQWRECLAYINKAISQHWPVNFTYDDLIRRIMSELRRLDCMRDKSPVRQFEHTQTLMH